MMENERKNLMIEDLLHNGHDKPQPDTFNNGLRAEQGNNNNNNNNNKGLFIRNEI